MRPVHHLNLSVRPTPNLRLSPWGTPMTDEQKVQHRIALRMERMQRFWDAVSVWLAIVLLGGSVAVLVMR